MSAALIFRSLANAGEHATPCALAIGNFDGVHLGHQSLLRTAVELATRHGLVTAALTFDPHPTTIVAPDRVPQKLCSFEDRLRLLQEAGAEQITVLPFTPEMARLSPQSFIQQVLIEALKVRFVIVGENFRFGYQQSGDSQTLIQVGREKGFEACLVPPVLARGEVVSSSKIRRYLNGNSVVRANRMLGRCFSITGDVVSGHGIGSKQTVTTLNLLPSPGLLTPNGVFVTRTTDRNSERSWQSITNVGNRPTFNGSEITIETFLLSSFQEPTPQQIRVELLHFIRPERAFPNPQALRAQIMRDVGRAQTYWRRIPAVTKAPASVY